METRDQNARLSRKWPSILIALLALALVALVLVRPRLATTANQPLETSLQSLPPLGSAEGYARATQPDAIEFPRDLGAHPDYQTEWWYYTGNLTTADGRPFGYQFTIFRRALAPPDVETPPVETEFLGRNSVSKVYESDWRSNQVYLAHFTISDPQGEAFYPTERFSRGGAGLAGATADPYHVWLEDWSITEIAPGQVRLHAKTDDVALDLVLTQTLPPILHGDGGLSQKGPEPGNASYYYSIVQQQTAGTVRVGAETFDVTGRSWKDHEWSTSALPPDAVGWDWFSLELDNGGALMLFQIRREDGTLEPTSAGSYITPDGQVQHLALGDWTLEVTDTWTSPTSGGEYPAGWRITVPAVGLALEGRPLLANQELNVSTVYWEGAVEFSGTLAGEPVGAQGYIEMTGYGGSMAGRL